MVGGLVVAGGSPGGHAAPQNKFAGLLVTVFAAFGGILYGYDTGVISGVKQMEDWLRTFGGQTVRGSYTISTTQESLVVSILSAGTLAGSLLAAPMGDLLGRKWGIIASTLVFSVGIALQTGALTFNIFVVGRVFAGLGIGMLSTLVPMYQSECAPKWIRGAVVSCYQLAITVGVLIASIINNATQYRRDHSAWRIPISIQFVWAVVLAFGMALLPESPRYLVKRGWDEAARQSLARLLSLSPEDPVVETELAEIRTARRVEREVGGGSYSECFKQGPNRILTRVMTGVFLQAWQQLTGINFIFYYGTAFFQLRGFSNPFFISVAIGVVNVVTTIPSIYLVDRVGRRSLLLIGAAGMIVCEFLVAIIGITVPTGNVAGQKAMIALVCIYIAFFAPTWGPIAWVVTGEIFPLNIRAKAISLSAASNWLWNFGIGYATPYLVNPGPGSADLGVKIFFIWGGTCVGCLLFAFFLIPETKGLSLEEIDVLYQNTNAIRSVAYRRQLIAESAYRVEPDAISPHPASPKANEAETNHKEHISEETAV